MHNGLSFRTLQQATSQLPQRHKEPNLDETEYVVVGALQILLKATEDLDKDGEVDPALKSLVEASIAATVSCMQCIAIRHGIILGEAVRKFFNDACKESNLPVRIGSDDEVHAYPLTTASNGN